MAIIRSSKNYGQKANGFTTFELLVVMAVMAIVIAVPAFYAFLNTQGVRLAADQMRGDLQLARMMAINRRQTCAIVTNHPDTRQYYNSLNRLTNDLSGYRGGVEFLAQGPDGRKAATQVAFNRLGRSTSAAESNIFLADRTAANIYRIRVAGTGGISVMRWNGTDWY